MEEHLYCDVCNDVIANGTTYLSVSIQREHLVPEDGSVDVDGFAEIVFACHEQCTPPSFEVELLSFVNGG